MTRSGTGARALLLAAVTAAALASPAAAQRFTVELRAGASVGNYTETDAGLELLPGPSFGVLAEARLTESVAGYVGFTRSSFGCEEAFCADRSVDLTSQGLVAGARWTPGFFWGRAGLAFQALQLTAEGQDQTSDPGIGWDLGAGIQFPVGQRVRVRPGVTYLRHGAATEGDDGHVAVLALEVGVAIGV